MSDETDTLRKSLDTIDRLRTRAFVGGWVIVLATLGVYGRLVYLQHTGANLARLLGASVTALTFVIAWAALAVIVTVTRTAKSILRAIELASRKG